MDQPLQILNQFPGRVVLAQPDGSLYVGRHTVIHRSLDDGATWERIAEIPTRGIRRAARLSRLASRLLRHEIRAMNRAPDGGLVAASRQGVYHGRPGEPAMRASEVDAGSLEAAPPMRIQVGRGGDVVWGEYLGVIQPGRPIRIFGSDDAGAHFEVVHEFAPGRVGHVHNVVFDEGRGHYWVLAGDHGPQAGIGMLSADFERFEWLVTGQQSFRVVEVFDFGDRLVYGTDTEVEPNAVLSLDKETGRLERHQELPGSCIYGCRFGDVYAISTSVEPSSVNRSSWCELWVSRDGARWKRAYRAEKDGWNAHYFQFGSIVLPSGRSGRDHIAWSGQAIKGLDGRGRTAALDDEPAPTPAGQAAGRRPNA